MAEVASPAPVATFSAEGAADDSEHQGSHAESSGDETVAAKPKDIGEVMAAVKKQVEFYFSDANLPTDKHLLKQIQKDPDGYVPLRMIANFKRVKALTKDLAVVAESLEDSTLLSLDVSESRVRRSVPLPAFDVLDISRRTVVAEHLPDKPTIESVTQLLSQYGNVVMVRICSRGNTSKLPAWLSKAVDAINMTMAPGEFALVEFASEDDCVACVNKTRNPDNWRTSLRVRHLLTNFKPSSKAGSRPASRSSMDHSSAGGGSHEGSGHHHGKQHHGRDSSTGGAAADGKRNTGSRRPSQDGKRPSLDGHHHQQQQHGKDKEHSGGSSSSSAAAGGMPVHLSPIRTHAAPVAEAAAAAQRAVSPCTRANGAVAPAPGLSPIRTGSGNAATGVGGAIGSPRVAKSPAPPDVTSFIDSILSAPTGSTPTRMDGRNSSSGGARWSGAGDWGSSSSAAVANLTPAAAVAAALAGVSTPPQSSSPRHSVPGASARPSQSGVAGAGAPGTPTRLSSLPAGAVVGGMTQGALAQQLAAAAAAAAQAAMSGSPRASQGSNAANWRSSSSSAGVGVGGSVSAPNTPLAGMSAGDAVAAALEASSPPARPLVVGSPELGKPGPWIPSSRLHHMQQAAAHDSHNAVRSSGSEAEDNTCGSWRSSWTGSTTKPPKPRTSGSGAAPQGTRQRRRSWHATEGDDGVSGELDGQAAAAAAGSSAAAVDGSNSDGGGTVGVSSSGSKSSSSRRSRLAQQGDYKATIEAIKEASCELDTVAAARAIASLSLNVVASAAESQAGRPEGQAGSSSGRHTQRRRSSHTGEATHGRDAGDAGEERDDEHEDGEGEGGKNKRRRGRRRSSTGSRRQSLDEGQPHPVGSAPAAGSVGGGSRRQSLDEGHGGGKGSSRRQSLDEGHGGGKCSSRRQSLDEPGCAKHGSRAGALSPEDASGQQHHGSHSRPHSASNGGSRQHSHQGSPLPTSHMAAAAEHHHRGSHDGSSKEGGSKKKEKKDYASWAAATPEFRAAAAAAKHSGGGSSGGAAAGGAGALGTSPGRAGLSPMRMSAGGAAGGGGPAVQHAHDGDSHVRIARMPDGTRGFGMGRGRPVTPPAP